MNNITTIILVAGKSSRFKSKKTKIFHDLAGLPIIDHIYNKAKLISNEIIFVCNKENINLVKKRFKNCQFALQHKQSGTADAVLSAKKFIKKNSNILILFGDTPLVTLISLKKLIHNFKINKSVGSILAFKSNNPFGYGRIIAENNNIVKEVVEEVNASSYIKKIPLCNAGIMICRYSLLFSFIKNINNKNKKREKYLPDIFKICFNNKKGFNYILCKEDEMLGINTLDDFNKVDKIYQNQIKQKLISSGVTIIDPETVRISFDTKIGKYSIIEPYVYIKNGVKIKNNVTIKSHTILEDSIIGKNSTVGPFARLRPTSIIGEKVRIGNYVEIKNSKIGSSTSVSHLSYIGDSFLGRNINVGAGTITCNFDGKNKNKTIIEDNVFIGSNTSLVAPVKIGKNSKTGAGSVIRVDIPPYSLVVGHDKLVKTIKNRRK